MPILRAWKPGKKDRHVSVQHIVLAKQTSRLISTEPLMQLSQGKSQTGNVLLCVLAQFWLCRSSAEFLLNCVSRSMPRPAGAQLKESLYACRSRGDVAFAEVRKTILDPVMLSADGLYWRRLFQLTYHFRRDSLKASSQVDNFYYDFNGNAWYRIRVKGTAPSWD